MAYWVYVVVCVDGSYYTGIATDVDRRIREHNGDKGTGLKGHGSKGRGARYTAARRPVALVHREAVA